MASFVNNDKGNCRLCVKPDTKENMVACDECDRWFHISCAKLDHMPEKDERWICVKCDAHEKDMMQLRQQLTKATIIKTGEKSGTSSEGNDQPWIVFLKRQALQQLPKFDGSPREWPTFKNIYDSTTEAGEFSNLENLNRLTQVLEGTAANSVKQVMISADIVPKIMERLEENFGRPEFVYNELLNELLKVKKSHRSVISEISDALENMVNNLARLKCKNNLYDHRLIDETVQKLPYNLQIRWTEVCQGNDNPPSLKDLNDWLRPHAKTQRLMNNSSNEKREHRVNVHEKKNVYESNQKKPYKLKCVLCNESHKIKFCDKFKSLEVGKRNDVIMRNRLCLCCLEGKHFANVCPTKRSCGIDSCGQYHNRLLHPMKTASNDDIEGITNHHQATRNNIFYQVVPVTLKMENQASIHMHS